MLAAQGYMYPDYAMCYRPASIRIMSYEEADRQRQIILCFDGTAYKFHGNEADSNVLKIFRVSPRLPTPRLQMLRLQEKMLDHNDSRQDHYFQPGFGTAISSRWLARHGHLNKCKALYLQAKDAAIGSSFSDHVTESYKYLMRHWSPESEIYIFGFSRGAYVARFLVDMIHYIGLVKAGNEELVSIAWTLFASWHKQRSMRETPEGLERVLYDHIKAFRETFCRSIPQVRFVGLFDTVNSIPKLENTWLRRSKFPVIVQSQGQITRHAVGIDERRTRFRPLLVSTGRGTTTPRRARIREILGQAHLHLAHQRGVHLGRDHNSGREKRGSDKSRLCQTDVTKSSKLGKSSNVLGRIFGRAVHSFTPKERREYLAGRSFSCPVEENQHSTPSNSASTPRDTNRDVEEVWFPGSHADIGGGWNLAPGEDWLVSHVPLVWMTYEAQQAGLRFDTEKLKQFKCWDEADTSQNQIEQANLPLSGGKGERPYRLPPDQPSQFEYALWSASTRGKVHDCLHYDGSIPRREWLFWRSQEYLPFRRMGMQQDQSWKPIRWPLPLGEQRRIPEGAKVHVSALVRMKENLSYRPDNLVGGRSGNSRVTTPANAEINDWEVCDHPGSLVRETYQRKMTR